MPQYLSKTEETAIRLLLDELAKKYQYVTMRKETYYEGYYLDRVWYVRFEGKRVPFIAFEVEKSVPSNERIRKDIMNLAWTKAPLGFIITAHSRIMKDSTGDAGTEWYKRNFKRVFTRYREPFAFYCKIRLLDADKLLSSKRLRAAWIF